MDTHTKQGLGIAAALIAAFFVGGITFTVIGGFARAVGVMHGGVPFTVSTAGSFDHSPMMDGYGRFNDQGNAWGMEPGTMPGPRGGIEGGERGMMSGTRGGGMRFAPQGEIPEGFGPPWMQDGATPGFDGECPAQPQT